MLMSVLFNAPRSDLEKSGKTFKVWQTLNRLGISSQTIVCRHRQQGRENFKGKMYLPGSSLVILKRPVLHRHSPGFTEP